MTKKLMYAHQLCCTFSRVYDINMLLHVGTFYKNFNLKRQFLLKQPSKRLFGLVMRQKHRWFEYSR